VPAVSEEIAPPPALPPVKPFTVRVLPLKNEGTTTTQRMAIEAYYSAMLDTLRAVPGLTLVEVDPAGPIPIVAADYQLTLSGRGISIPGQIESYSAGMEGEKVGPDGSTRQDMRSYIDGPIAAPCAGVVDDLSCTDPPSVAAFFVRTLRIGLFPPDASWRQQMLAQLLDGKADPKRRLKVLGDLVQLNGKFPGAGDTAGTNVQQRADQDLVRGAVALAAAADPAVRAQVWRTMREVHSTALIPALTTASRKDADGEARLEAVATLGSFANDERVRATLETVSREDPRPLVRAVAQRGLGGEAAWREYVIASLKDASHTEAERVEALMYATYQRNTPGSVASYSLFSFRMLDDEAVRTLVQLLPGLRASAEFDRYRFEQLVRDVAWIRRPVVTDLLLASLQGDSGLVDRATAVQALRDRRDDPRVRAALDAISANDPDPQLRLMAATPGDQLAAASASAKQPLRLGVMFTEARPGSNVPDELIGKPLVSGVMQGSVADKAGVLEGDVLLEINGAQISALTDSTRILDTLSRDIDVDVVVYRSGERVSLKARF
jgi:hypothetical protein